MGRTATAFLVLIAIGGCIADDAGPVGVMPVAKTGQPAPVPSYATWNRTDQFAALQDDRTANSVNGSGALTPVGKGDMLIAQKPLAMHKPAATPAPSDVVVPPPAAPVQTPTPQLAAPATVAVVQNASVPAPAVTTPPSASWMPRPARKSALWKGTATSPTRWHSPATAGCWPPVALTRPFASGKPSAACKSPSMRGIKGP